MPKAGHRLALGMKLQKEVISNQAVKKGAASKKARVKRCEIQGGGREMAVMVG